MSSFSCRRIAVALSGGADSLFALLRLRDAGFPVLGVHGIFARDFSSVTDGFVDWSNSVPDQALGVMEALKTFCRLRAIPFQVLDCSEIFIESVIRPFVQAYARGLTPNPCALCNKFVKFGAFQEKALALGAGWLASGHYARTGSTASGVRESLSAWLAGEDQVLHLLGQAPELALADAQTLERFHPPGAAYQGRFVLQGADPVKEQSYFLALTPGTALEHAFFPLGGRIKQAIRHDLELGNIAIPQPEESQELCFIPGKEYRSFVQAAAQSLGVSLPGPGPILLEDGSRLGTHQGLWRYTEGQRKGLGVCWKEALFVQGKDPANNCLLLGPGSSPRSSACSCSQVNMFIPEEYWPETVLVKTRYREAAGKARVTLDLQGKKQGMHVQFLHKERSPAPGQVAAVYAPVFGVHEADGRPVLCLLAGGLIDAPDLSSG